MACSAGAGDGDAPDGSALGAFAGNTSVAGATSAGLGGSRSESAGSANVGGTLGGTAAVSAGAAGTFAGVGSSSPGGAGSAGAAAGDGGSSAGSGPGNPVGDGFVHPGILVSRAMLDFVKAKVAAGAEPWKGALAKAQASNAGSLGYTPHARKTVECGSFSNPDVGCSDEKNDCVAAYTHALLWAYTGNEAHAKKAIQIMNAWSAVLEGHTNSNAPLQSAWVAETFPRAAEIIRHTYTGWPDAESERFGQMLDEVYRPMVEKGSPSNGNWETSMIEATLNIAIFNDDRALFDAGLKMWRERTPAYVYVTSDGAKPVPPPRGNKSGAALLSYWYDQSTFVDGVSQETCRDLSHAQYGFAGIVNAAETARIQGVDLYGEHATRLQAMLEFHAKYLNGASVPAWLCGGSLTDNRADPMWEIGFNHFAGRRAQALPETQKLLNAIRPTGTDHHMAWETLTHAGLGAAGL